MSQCIFIDIRRSMSLSQYKLATRARACVCDWVKPSVPSGVNIEHWNTQYTQTSPVPVAIHTRTVLRMIQLNSPYTTHLLITTLCSPVCNCWCKLAVRGDRLIQNASMFQLNCNVEFYFVISSVSSTSFVCLNICQLQFMYFVYMYIRV